MRTGWYFHNKSVRKSITKGSGLVLANAKPATIGDLHLLLSGSAHGLLL